MVPIISDDTFELDERFQASLGYEEGIKIPGVALRQPEVNITIVDDDGK